MLKNTFSLICFWSRTSISTVFCMPRYSSQFLPSPFIFHINHINMRIHGNHFAKNQMEPNGTFLDNSKYDHWIQHKKLV